MCLQPAYLLVASAGEEMSNLHVECTNPPSYLQQKIYLRIKDFATELYRDPSDKVHYRQNNKYTLSIK